MELKSKSKSELEQKHAGATLPEVDVGSGIASGVDELARITGVKNPLEEPQEGNKSQEEDKSTEPSDKSS